MHRNSFMIIWSASRSENLELRLAGEALAGERVAHVNLHLVAPWCETPQADSPRHDDALIGCVYNGIPRVVGQLTQDLPSLKNRVLSDQRRIGLRRIPARIVD